MEMQVLRNKPILILLPLLLVFLSVHEVTLAPFQPVSSPCIYWDSLKFHSEGHSKTLHCILDEKGQLGIVNVTSELVQSGHCPYFDRYNDIVSLKPCDKKLGKCPEEPIYSYQAVQYPACYGTQRRNDSNLDTKDSDVQDTSTSFALSAQHNCGQCNSLLITIIVLSSLILLAISGMFLRLEIHLKKMLKKERNSDDDEDKFRVDVNPVEQNGHTPLLEKPSLVKDKDELMNICLRLVKAQFEKEQVELSALEMAIPEKDREYMEKQMKNALNALSPNKH